MCRTLHSPPRGCFCTIPRDSARPDHGGVALPRSGPILLVYALTLFLSALLLFLVQPLIGKLIVPLLGGLPAVWNTCLVFFQAMLLAGYAYAHYSGNWLGERRQAAVHLAVLLLPAVVLPLGVAPSLVPAGGANPIPGLLLLLVVSAGLPFFTIAATAPLLQRWFANTTHPAAKGPVLPLRRQQRRQYARPSRLPHPRRAEPDSRPAALGLVGRLRAARAVAGRLCRPLPKIRCRPCRRKAWPPESCARLDGYVLSASAGLLRSPARGWRSSRRPGEDEVTPRPGCAGWRWHSCRPA